MRADRLPVVDLPVVDLAVVDLAVVDLAVVGGYVGTQIFSSKSIKQRERDTQKCA
jgi:hypothetical protein